MSATPIVVNSAFEEGYTSRLVLMEDWYNELIRLDNREQILFYDYAPHVEFLGRLRGRVLDMGGGAGVAARFMDPHVDYVVVDPLELWNEPEWVEFGRHFRAGGPQPQFISASGEQLPFALAEFDSVLSYWSLNHVRDPERCVAEMARVLRSGGTARIVIDDVEPGWRDLFGDAAHRLWRRLSGGTYDLRIPQRLSRAFAMKLSGRWTPTQRDHSPIRAADIVRWASKEMSLTATGWANASLTLDFVRR